jgi:hypothetical protein
MEITLKLDLNEVNGLLNVMGQLPTSTNIWPLAAKVRAQAEAQIPKQEAPAETSEQ